ILLVGDIGFAILKPASNIEEVIAADPTSPIAVAHEMARRNGWVPGRSLVLRLIPLLPAALMTLADPLRRWRLAAGIFALAMVVTSAPVLGRLPALSHALPSVLDGTIALPVALACAIGSAWCGLKTADGFARVTPRLPVARSLEAVAAKS